MRDSNPRPAEYKSAALTSELMRLWWLFTNELGQFLSNHFAYGKPLLPMM